MRKVSLTSPLPLPKVTPKVGQGVYRETQGGPKGEVEGEVKTQEPSVYRRFKRSKGEVGLFPTKINLR